MEIPKIKGVRVLAHRFGSVEPTDLVIVKRNAFQSGAYSIHLTDNADYDKMKRDSVLGVTTSKQSAIEFATQFKQLNNMVENKTRLKLKSLVMEIIRDKSRKKRRLSENLKVDQKVVQQYLNTALWAASDDSLYNEYDAGNFADSEWRVAEKDLTSFLQRAEGLLPEDVDMKKVAHDFWLSRNGHGAGFFDADYVEDDVRDQLQSIAEKFREKDVVVGDDGKLYFE